MDIDDLVKVGIAGWFLFSAITTAIKKQKRKQAEERAQREAPSESSYGNPPSYAARTTGQGAASGGAEEGHLSPEAIAVLEKLGIPIPDELRQAPRSAPTAAPSWSSDGSLSDESRADDGSVDYDTSDEDESGVDYDDEQRESGVDYDDEGGESSVDYDEAATAEGGGRDEVRESSSEDDTDWDEKTPIPTDPSTIDYDESGYDEAAFMADMRRKDVWLKPAPTQRGAPAASSTGELLRDALILRTIFAPPRSRSGRRRGVGR